MKHVIKERQNPQLGIYFVAVGEVTNKEAKRLQGSTTLYGHNTYYVFDSKEEYDTEIERLKASGEHVQ